jgi:hypothetical protein
LAPRWLAYLEISDALLGERRGECPGAVPILVCHAEVVVECEVERAADVEAWLKKATIEGMETVLDDAGEINALRRTRRFHLAALTATTRFASSP